MRKLIQVFLTILVLSLAAGVASAQSFRVQCPTNTITHPANLTNVNVEPAYTGPTTLKLLNGYPNSAYPAGASDGFLYPTANVNGAIKCQQISGGDGYSTMADGTQTFMFSFGPLSGLADIANGLPGTQFPAGFNTLFPGTMVPGDPATTDGALSSLINPNFPSVNLASFTYNGAVGLAPDLDAIAAGTCAFPCLDGHVDSRQIMDVGVMNGNIPAPLMAFDEDDEFFLTLTNVGMIMRPDLFEQHTVHFHGYPNASSFYDGVPDASVAINIGGSFTYYYLAPDAGTYFWHCHITPPEHLQMGMVGQLYVRPRQNRVPSTMSIYQALKAQETDLRTACISAIDILCSNPLPATGDNNTPGGFTGGVATKKYAYNDGDGVSAYDVEYPLQIHGFDPNFHFVGMTFNPENFATMKDKFFLLNGRSYPDTINPNPMVTQTSDGRNHFSQPLPSVINITAGQKALIRLSDLSVSEYATLASLGVRMHVVGYNAKLLRDQAGNNLDYYTNSVTIGGGESLDFILDTSDAGCGTPGCAAAQYTSGSVFFLYTPQLDHLSNGEENFGGLMTEIHIN